MFTFDPFRNFELVRREVDRAFEDLLSVSTGRRPTMTGLLGSTYPLVNIGEDNNEVVVESLLPGVDADKIDVKVLRDQLTISGELAEGGNGDDESVHRRERFTGKFFRSVTLPAEVDPDKVTAQYRNGVLRISAEKAASARPRRIEIAA